MHKDAGHLPAAPAVPVRKARAFPACCSGATAIEYALIAFFISLGIATAVPLVGQSVYVMLESVAGLF